LEVAKLQSLSPIQSKGKAKELLGFIREQKNTVALLKNKTTV